MRAQQPCLQSLNVRGNALAAQGVVNLCPGLAAAPALQSVALRDVAWRGRGSAGGLAAAAALAAAAVKCETLLFLDIEGNPIGAPPPE